ncbi:MAG: Holliday junction branch migration DNA helicase RuvB [Parachlamydiales bacterium]|jgi:Holliday junction DNA helicase RuvB
MTKSFIESSLCQADLTFEVPIRPENLKDFTGQASVCDRLDILISAAKHRGEALGHCLLCGPPGLGKTTLAHIIAKAMGTQLVVTSGPAMEKAGDLAGILTKLQPGDVLFIDEIHRLNRAIEEYLYPAMEDYNLDIFIDSGPNASSVRLKLHPFTLIGATTRVGSLTAPLRSRFSLQCRLEYYPPEELQSIIQRTAALLKIDLTDQAAWEIARRSRGTPRIANNLVRWARDYATVHKADQVCEKVALKALNMLSIDELGLDEMDLRILTVMIDHYNGRHVGINAIAASVGEDASTIEEVYEPYLILQGLICRTPRGREVTPAAYRHLKREPAAQRINTTENIQ